MPVKYAHNIAPHCPNCGSGEYMTNEDGNQNQYCGQCGTHLDWDNKFNIDNEEINPDDDCRLEKNQRYFPEKGYTGPIETKEKCPNPAFYNEYKHRVGHFIVGTYDDGYQIQNKCVNCGKKFGRVWFMWGRRKNDGD